MKKNIYMASGDVLNEKPPSSRAIGPRWVLYKGVVNTKNQI